jgi:hypothetical protein
MSRPAHNAAIGPPKLRASTITPATPLTLTNTERRRSHTSPVPSCIHVCNRNE